MQFVQSVPAAMVLRDHDDGELWVDGDEDGDEDDQTVFLSSEHVEASIITIDPDIITIT